MSTTKDVCTVLILFGVCYVMELLHVNCESNTDDVVAGYKVDKEKRTGLNRKCIL